jgi:PKD repeat protein
VERGHPGGDYYLQEVWSNADRSCEPRAKADRISFHVTPRPRTGLPVSFSARASDPDGAIVSYDWFFGDGATDRRRRGSHTFSRPGHYAVVLRTTDSADNYAFCVRTINVSRR